MQASRHRLRRGADACAGTSRDAGGSGLEDHDTAGSHIPADRNGLKFYTSGEITKADEAAILAHLE